MALSMQLSAIRNLYTQELLRDCSKIPAELPDKPAHFEKMDELNSRVWGMAVADHSLFISTDDGSFIFKNDKFSPLNNFPSRPILPSRFDHDIIYTGLTDGIAILRKINGQWTDGGKILGVEAETSELLETTTGDLWASTFSEGVFFLKFPLDKWIYQDIQHREKGNFLGKKK